MMAFVMMADASYQLIRSALICLLQLILWLRDLIYCCCVSGSMGFIKVPNSACNCQTNCIQDCFASCPTTEAVGGYGSVGPIEASSFKEQQSLKECAQQILYFLTCNWSGLMFSICW